MPGISRLPAHAPGASDSILIPTAGTGRIAALREGMDAASNELLVVLDPHRAYTPQAIVEVIEGLLTSDADLAIAVPRRDRHRSWWRYAGAALPGIVEPVNPGYFGLVLGVDRYSTLAIAGGHESPPRSRLAACP